ncbi:MAG: outer membrane protein transport protein [Sphingobacteriaceae bacterium]|nr:outer membrane protein transport protein [Sphingobacteriaceae bacterium]
MYKKIIGLVSLFVWLGVQTNAQITIQSPYSKFGIGNLKAQPSAQTRAIGGLATAIGSLTTYSSVINMQNPASYVGLYSTTVDVGAIANFTTLAQNGHPAEKSFTGNFSHLALGFNTSKKSGLSFGLVPYSELGYDIKNSIKIDTMNVDQIYRGEGGLSKAYMGFGHRIGEKLSVGLNVEYVFGNLLSTKSVEFPADRNVISSRMQQKNSVGGLTLSYGAQYATKWRKTTVTFGYSGSMPTNINSKSTEILTQYARDSGGNESSALDTLQNIQKDKVAFKIPMTHNFGVVFHQDNKWMLGADLRTGNWSKYSVGGQNQGLQDSWGLSLGGQIIPDITSIGSYFNRVEYRAGFMYDKTYVRFNNQDIKQMAFTVGLGLPLASNRFSFYKMNIAAEFGNKGSLTNNLIKENYVNIHFGITLNDTWFRRYKFD